MLSVDHVVLAVRDLDVAAAWLGRHGILSVPGGVHARWGTGNRIAPFGATYIELLAVIDEHIATETVLGRALLERSEGGDRWFALCLADDAIDETATRLGLTVEAGARTRPDGIVVRWRGAGIEDSRRTPDLPFLISWETPDVHPGRTLVDHPAGATGIGSIEMGGDEAAFDAWTAGAALPVRFVDGARGVRAVVLESSSGPIRLEGARA